MDSTTTKSLAPHTKRTRATVRRLIGALGLSAAGGAGVRLGGHYLIDLIQGFTSTAMRIDVLATTVILAVGLILAAWYTLSGLVAAACLGLRLTGLVWAEGETWVRRRGAPAMRRFLGGSAGAVIIAGSMLSPAYAEEAEDPPDTGPSPVHLTWAPTAEPAPDPAAGNPATPEDITPEDDQAPPPTPDQHDLTPPGADDEAGGRDETEDSTSEDDGERDADRDGERHDERDGEHDEGQPTTTQPAAAGDGTPGAGSSDERVLVRPGDTLWSIAADDLGPGATDAQIAELWPQWYRANAGIITDPHLIHPGQQLATPDGRNS